MRSSKSRSRSKGNRNRSVGNIVNRVFDSSGPEGKVRGTPQQIIDKYNQLARDAQLSNDRVAAENFQQHAEHYLRMLAEAQREMQERQQQNQAQQGNQNPGGNDNDQSRGDRQGGGQQADQQAGSQPDDRSSNDGDQRGDGRRGRGRNRFQDGGRQQQPEPRNEVVDAGQQDASEDGGLVETPEDRPKRQRRPRKPSEQQAESDQIGQPTPDAAE